MPFGETYIHTPLIELFLARGADVWEKNFVVSRSEDIEDLFRLPTLSAWDRTWR